MVDSRSGEGMLALEPGPHKFTTQSALDERSRANSGTRTPGPNHGQPMHNRSSSNPAREKQNSQYKDYSSSYSNAVHPSKRFLTHAPETTAGDVGSSSSHQIYNPNSEKNSTLGRNNTDRSHHYGTYHDSQRTPKMSLNHHHNGGHHYGRGGHNTRAPGHNPLFEQFTDYTTNNRSNPTIYPNSNNMSTVSANTHETERTDESTQAPSSYHPHHSSHYHNHRRHHERLPYGVGREPSLKTQSINSSTNNVNQLELQERKLEVNDTSRETSSMNRSTNEIFSQSNQTLRQNGGEQAETESLRRGSIQIGLGYEDNNDIEEYHI